MNQDHKVLHDYANDLYLASDQLGLSEWERDFVFDMVGMKTYSPKQGEKILQIAEKYDL